MIIKHRTLLKETKEDVPEKVAKAILY